MPDTKEYREVSRSSTSEDVPFLGEVLPPQQSKFRRALSRLLLPLVVHGTIMMVYLALLSLVFHKTGSRKYCHTPLVYSPAQDAVVYEKVDYDGSLYKTNLYKGPPSPESDAAWTELVDPTNIRLTKEDLKKINRTALELSDHSGYHGGMGVHHHLHCLKYIRQALHPEYYFKELNVDPDLMEHVYHCIDDVRQALMCNPDISIYTHVWVPGYRKPWPNFDVEHECVNWDILNGWAKKNSFDMFEPNLLIHPELGLSFPIIDGKIQLSALSNTTVFVHPDQDLHDPAAHGAHGGH
ncbi:hypothetical protein F5Y17DRAFT_474350 [Xylariaceae sp. FL0594]|nr:hypothetical protein F5Y17DRAFT_474350 [Xylariaceae sp. FL0594]